jgi:hypothetical protein
MATPNFNPLAQNQDLSSQNQDLSSQDYTSENIIAALRSVNQVGNGANIDFLPNLGEAIRQGRPITQADLTGTEAGLSGTRPVGGGEIGYRLDATLDPLDTGGVVGGVDYDVGFTKRKFGVLPAFMEEILRPTGVGVGIRGAVEGNTADFDRSPDPQEEFYGNLGLNIPLTGTNIEGSFVKPNDTSTESNLELNQAIGPANFRYKRVVKPGIDDAEEFNVGLPYLEASYSKSPFGTNTLQGGVNFPVGNNTYVSLEGGQQKRKGSTQKDWAARINTDVNGTGIGALLRGDSSRNKRLEVNVDRPLPGFKAGTGSLSGKLFQTFNSTGPNPLNFEVAAEVPVSRDLTAAISGNIERSREGNTFGGQLELKAMQDRLGLLAKYETDGEKSVGVRYNLPTDKIPDSLKNLFR